MHSANFHYYKNGFLLAKWLIITPFLAFGQKKIPINWNLFRPEVGDHWVATVFNSPEISSRNSLILNTGAKIEMRKISDLTVGITFLKSSPKRTFTYGMSAGYNYSLNDIQAFNASYRYDIQSVGTSILVGLQKPNIVGRNHPFIHLGLTQRFLLNPKLSVFTTKLTNYDSDIGVNRFPMSGYLEMGLQQDEFLASSSWSRLKNLSVSMDFPFFNLSNFFTTNRKNYNASTIGFFNTTNPQVAFRLNYQQFIDVKPVRLFEPEVGDIYKRHRFLPPLVSVEDPEHPLFGRIFIEFAFGSQKDSVNVGAKNTNPKLIPNSIFNQIGVGYNLHFGNYRDTYDPREKNRNTYINAFVGVSIFKNSVTSASINLYKYESIGVKTEAGFRLGKGKYYLLGGGGFQFLEFSKEYTQNLNTQDKDVQLPYKNKFSYFYGVSFKNLLTLRLTHIDTDIIREKPVSYFDSIYYSVAIGF
jgi:hypothetical protein